ncbi:hypothetical protein ACH5RR_016649 [Cinchona calisaya]|uniref:Uncharacterized protein n=1 Tax=Cinchona calisaya TaxID=153742 RepID=A0ABD2ZZZ4_9GENT
MSYAAFAMNSWNQTKGGGDFNCDFSHTGVPQPVPVPALPAQGKKWCVTKAEATDAALQTFAMNSWNQTKGGGDFNCDFSHTGVPQPVPVPALPAQGKKWCVTKAEATDAALQTFAMNSWNQTKGGGDFNCDFSHTGVPQPVPVPALPAQGKKWCVTKAEATDAALQSNIDYTFAAKA